MEEMTLAEYLERYAGQAVRVRQGRRSRRNGRSRGFHGGRDWRAVLEAQMEEAGLPEPEREYLFHAERKWRFDYAWPVEGFALEFEGGIWMATETGRSKGHAHPKRFLADCEKYNEAALYGWYVLRVTGEMVADGRALAWLKRALIEQQ